MSLLRPLFTSGVHFSPCYPVFSAAFAIGDSSSRGATNERRNRVEKVNLLARYLEAISPETGTAILCCSSPPIWIGRVERSGSVKNFNIPESGAAPRYPAAGVLSALNVKPIVSKLIYLGEGRREARLAATMPFKNEPDVMEKWVWASSTLRSPSRGASPGHYPRREQIRKQTRQYGCFHLHLSERRELASASAAGRRWTSSVGERLNHCAKNRYILHSIYVQCCWACELVFILREPSERNLQR